MAPLFLLAGIFCALVGLSWIFVLLWATGIPIVQALTMLVGGLATVIAVAFFED